MGPQETKVRASRASKAILYTCRHTHIHREKEKMTETKQKREMQTHRHAQREHRQTDSQTHTQTHADSQTHGDRRYTGFNGLVHVCLCTCQSSALRRRLNC